MSTRKRTRSTEGPGRPFADPDWDTRTQLLNAAAELFAEQGVAATSFTTIARRAGLTPAMVHYHFSDREQLDRRRRRMNDWCPSLRTCGTRCSQVTTRHS